MPARSASPLICIKIKTMSASNNPNEKGRLIAALLIGAAAGAALGLLLAPRKGSETRDMFAEKASELADELKRHFTGSSEAGFQESGKDKDNSL
jgi:gas vesicle protein